MGRFDDLRKRAEAMLRERPTIADDVSADEIRDLLHELDVHQIELEMQNAELRKAQLELEVSRHRYIDLYDFAPVGYLTIGESGLILEANLTSATLLGVERESLIRHPFSRFVTPADQDIYYFHCKHVFETSLRQSCELRLVKRDGTLFYAQLESVAARDDKGNAHQYRTTLSDITTRKQAEEALYKREQEFKTLVENAPDMIVRFDREYRCVYANPAVKKELGSSAQMILDVTHRELGYSPEESSTLERFLDQVFQSGQEHVFEWSVPTEKGLKHYLSRSVPEFAEDGTVTSVLFIHRNVTDRKQAEEQRIQLAMEQQRILALHEFLRDARHDLMTPLSVIKTSVYLIRKVEGKDQLAQLGKIEAQTMRLQKMIQDMLLMSELDMTSAKDLVFSPINLDSLLQAAAEKIRPVAEEHRQTVSVECYTPLVHVLGDADLLSVALSNLLENAVQYTGSSGTIRLLCTSDHEQIEISIIDSGYGIAEEDLPHIFERFYRAEKHRPSNGGLGLGLSVAQRVIELHSGRIEVESHLGQTSTFRVLLPIS